MASASPTIVEPTRARTFAFLEQLFQHIRSSELWVITCFAFVVRAIVVCFAYRHVAAPSNDFHQFSAEMGWVARSIATGHGFSSPFFPATGPTALVPPLFPYVLAGIFRLFGLFTTSAAVAVLLMDSALSALTCIPIVLTVRKIGNPSEAKLAGWIWAVYPFAIYFSAVQVWDYALTAFLSAWTFYLILRFRRSQSILVWFGIGLLCGLTALSNPSVISIFALLFLWSGWKLFCSRKSWLRPLTAAALAFSLFAGPWIVRDYKVMHQVIPIRDGFWLEFWAGNHGNTFETNPGEAHPASNPIEMQRFISLGETGYLASKHALAADYVRAYPVKFVAVSLRRFTRFWTGFWSFNPAYLRGEPLDVPNLFHCSAITLLMLMGLRRLWKERVESATPYLIVIAMFPVTYYLTHSSMDYREPIEPQIVQLVALGIGGYKAWAKGGYRRAVSKAS